MYLVSYDISSNQLRKKIARLLEGYGLRVQYSVFECRLNEKQFKKMYGEMLELTSDLTEGSVRYYTICANCEKKLLVTGDAVMREEPEEDVIVI